MGSVQFGRKRSRREQAVCLRERTRDALSDTLAKLPGYQYSDIDMRPRAYRHASLEAILFNYFVLNKSGSS